MRRKWIMAAAFLAALAAGGQAADAALKGEAPRRKTAQTVQTKKVQNTKDKDSAAAQKLKKDGKSPVIEVGLLSGQAEVKIRCLGDTSAEAGGKLWKTYKKGETISVSRSGDQIKIDGKKQKGPVYLKMKKDGEAAFAVKGNTYRGDIKLLPSAYRSGVTVVNAVPMEAYLCGVVPSEISPSWHADAVKAQAVAARTYAMYHRDGYRDAGYDVTDDTRSQVYRGTAVESAATNQAVYDTAGEVVTYQGKPIDAVFHSNGGGYTENSENVWGSKIPYLRGVREESSSVVNKAWTKTVALSDFQNKLGIGKLKKIELSKLKKGPVKAKDRGVSGRVRTFSVTGSKGKKDVTGDQMRSLFGLNSTLFDLKVKGKDLIITGYGSGHGLGLSQWGAEAMAAKNGDGKDYYKKILTHYFTDTKIEKIY